MRTDEDYEGVIFVELIKEALSLIRDQEKRIEEIETSCTELARDLHACKAETVRKMQEKLKEYLDDFYTTEEDALLDVPDLIDQIAKEILEENT